MEGERKQEPFGARKNPWLAQPRTELLEGVDRAVNGFLREFLWGRMGLRSLCQRWKTHSERLGQQTEGGRGEDTIGAADGISLAALGLARTGGIYLRLVLERGGEITLVYTLQQACPLLAWQVLCMRTSHTGRVTMQLRERMSSRVSLPSHTSVGSFHISPPPPFSHPRSRQAVLTR